jgi:hypothetical protein
VIRTEEQLYALGVRLTGNLKGYYRLDADIALSARAWTPMFEYEAFTGTLDGDGHRISGLSIPDSTYGSSSYTGLFGQNSGTIKNLTVSGSAVGSGYVGILVGYNNSGTIENCLTEGSAENTGSGRAGGLVGDSGGTISRSGSTAAVTGKNGNTGGLVGASEAGLKVVNCYARGKVTGTNSYTGGLVGYLYRGEVRNCYASGSVKLNEGAGLIGTQSDGKIYNSYYLSSNTGNKLGFGMTNAELKEQETYYCWDFGNIWTMGEEYPEILVRGQEDIYGITEGSGTADDP